MYFKAAGLLLEHLDWPTARSIDSACVSRFRVGCSARVFSVFMIFLSMDYKIYIIYVYMCTYVCVYISHTFCSALFHFHLALRISSFTVYFL